MPTCGSQSWTRPNRVLEVTIHQACYPVTEHVLRQVFSPFGDLEEVQVFGGLDHVSAHVVFLSKYDAVEAFGELHGRNIYDDCCQLDIQYGVPSEPDLSKGNNTHEVDAHKMFNGLPACSSQSWTPPSRVLEVTIHKACYPVTEHVLRQVFSPFGDMEQVQVFGGLDHVSAQVVFRSKYKAVKAFGELHGRNIYDGCCQLDIKYGAPSEPDVSKGNTHEVDTYQVFDGLPTCSSQSWTPPNRVLEVTIHNACYPVTEHVLRQVFSPFGDMEQVQVFGGLGHVSAQVVFRSKYDAVEAFGELHGRNIYDGCCQLDIQYGVPSEPDISMVKGIATASSSSLLFPSSTVIKTSLDDLSSDILPMDAAASGAHTKAAISMEAQRGINAIFLPVPDVVNHDDVNESQASTTPTREQHQDANWDKWMERLDVLHAHVTDIGSTQQQLLAKMNLNSQDVKQASHDQQLMVKQIEDIGKAVARLALEHMDAETLSSPRSLSLFSIPPQQERPFSSVQPHPRTEPSHHRPFGDSHHNYTPLPEMLFPNFEGVDPKIWLDKCENYFCIFNVHESMWVTSASLHMEGSAARWWQVYKQQNGLGTWTQFKQEVESKFGTYAYREALNELLELKQTGTVEDYVTTFEALQCQLLMHNNGYDELFFIFYFIKGLKWDIKAAVQAQVPDTMARAIKLAKAQQQILDNSKQKYQKSGKAPLGLGKVDSKLSPPGQALWKEWQLRDYRRANDLCLYCGEKFDANHIEHCTKDQRLRVASGVTPAKVCTLSILYVSMHYPNQFNPVTYLPSEFDRLI